MEPAVSSAVSLAQKASGWMQPSHPQSAGVAKGHSTIPKMTVPLALSHSLPETKPVKRVAAQALHYHHVGPLPTPGGQSAICTESAEDPI